ncbi:hypothetical protein FVE85_0056 [Porphyridium purpureum]|uniref:Uncharacterized protein n=1 Tax=Porphyridium purpureum TaxID=35688 RepID=A0A5J4Z0X3_PORPP|nr:hypothetical protein FVE85_0056 [Porphyridium purpureum]|eukprot:POR8850..scf208_2
MLRWMRQPQLAQQMTGKAEAFGEDSVPLFYLEGLAFKRNGARVFPLFFNYEELNAYVQQLRKQGTVDEKTLEASNVNIVDLNMVLSELASPRRDPIWNEVVFLPPQDGMNFVKAVQK